MPPGDVLDALVWGQVRRVVIDPTGTIVDAGRRRRLFTGRLREMVLLGSARCTWPGCTRPSSTTEADHRTEWHHHGETNLANGDPCCARHNRHKTTGGYRVWRDPDGYWHHYRPDGTELGEAAA